MVRSPQGLSSPRGFLQIPRSFATLTPIIEKQTPDASHSWLSVSRTGKGFQNQHEQLREPRSVHTQFGGCQSLLKDVPLDSRYARCSPGHRRCHWGQAPNLWVGSHSTMSLCPWGVWEPLMGDG